MNEPEDIKIDGKRVVSADEVIDRQSAEKIDASDIDVVKVRSPITCKTLYGICSNCYGFDLGKNKLISKGEAVGVLAAQSIGEPGTQLTMRTFHSGGIAGADITHGLPRVEELFEARIPKGKAFLAEEEGMVDDLEEKGLLKILKISSKMKGKTKVFEYPVHRSLEIYVKVGQEVKRGDQLCEGHLDLKEVFKLSHTQEP